VTIRTTGRNGGFLLATILAANLQFAMWSSSFALAAVPVKLNFARDVRPVLSRYCFHCHGPDASTRKAGLRLDTQEGAFRDLGGYHAFEAGKVANSEVYLRLTTSDPDDLMPPPDTGKKMRPEEIGIVRTWIEQGASWSEHWAFEPISPQTKSIDALVRERLSQNRLSPNTAATPVELLRRVALDLTGLPPNATDVESFVRNSTESQYRRLIDKYLASPSYGERWASMWLDLARYADSRGYEKDRNRTMWRYRDWVIDALNTDLPYDQFLTLQLAGDLMPAMKGKSSAPDPLLATAFHRNTMTNDEGGTDDEEFRIAAVKDRVDTTMSVAMGLTAGCAKCHDHKYDPITQRDYYQLFAFFNQAQDTDAWDDGPLAPFPTTTQSKQESTAEKRLRVAERATELKALVSSGFSSWKKSFVETVKDDIRDLLMQGKVQPVRWGAWYEAGPFFLDEKRLSKPQSFPPELSPGAVNVNETYKMGEVKWKDRGLHRDGLLSVNAPKDAAIYFARTFSLSTDRRVALSMEGAKQLVVWVDGKRIENKDDQFGFDLTLSTGTHNLFVKAVVVAGEGNVKVTPVADEVAGLPADIAQTLFLNTDKWTPAQRLSVAKHFVQHASLKQTSALAIWRELQQAEESLAKVRRAFPLIPIIRELPSESRRATNIHVRGSFLSKGDAVEPNVPTAFAPFDAAWPKNRIGLSQWLTGKQNPLTARVAVNRLWARLFGTGLVETEEDFGSQGSQPSHPELLDALAWSFMNNGWSTKAILRQIVLSATYRQSAQATGQQRAKDPRNVLLSRGPRLSLEAEMVRDRALSAAGLLSEKMYGPSVMPPQPEGLWRSVYNADSWVLSAGDDRYRRAVYTFVKRTTPYPSAVTFDAPSRELCTPRRVRSNTPLQALVTMNDPVFMDAARGLARRALDVRTKPGSGFGTASLQKAFYLALLRAPTQQELQTLNDLYQERLAAFQRDDLAAKSFAGELSAGQSAAQAAAMTAVSNVILNMDEFLVRG
jgi:hypothetical protein